MMATATPRTRTATRAWMWRCARAHRAMAARLGTRIGFRHRRAATPATVARRLRAHHAPTSTRWTAGETLGRGAEMGLARSPGRLKAWKAMLLTGSSRPWRCAFPCAWPSLWSPRRQRQDAAPSKPTRITTAIILMSKSADGIHQETSGAPATRHAMV